VHEDCALWSPEFYTKDGEPQNMATIINRGKVTVSIVVSLIWVGFGTLFLLEILVSNQPDGMEAVSKLRSVL
jgi:hypothetical protein